MDDAAKMYELQKVDLTWAKVRRRLMEIQKRLGESDELRDARSQVEASETDLHQWQTQQQDFELESKSIAERIKEADELLMNGSISNPKELEAMQANVESLRRQLATAEDSSVEALMNMDEFRGKLEDQRKKVESLEEAWMSNQKTLQAEEKKMKRNYMLLKHKRESVAKALGQPLLQKYEQMRKRRGGVAVAPVKEEECGACHVSLPTGVISALHSNSDELVLCTSCGRFLVQN